MATRIHRDQSGSVSLLLVFVFICLAALAFFVFNTGDQVNQAVMTQNTADAAAIAGGNWMAHGYNTIAMNNVATTRLLALVAMLEALPLSIDPALQNAETILPRFQILASSLPDRDVGGIEPDTILSKALVGPVDPCESAGFECESLLEECQQAIAKLREMRALVDRFDRLYEVDGGFPGALTRFEDGHLWRAIRALQAFSQIMVEVTPSMAQLRTCETGRELYGDSSRKGSAVLLPILPQFDVHAGSFEDYRDPTMAGLPPDWQINRAEVSKGGYHTIINARWPEYWPSYEFQAWQFRPQIGSGVSAPELEGERESERPRRDDRGAFVLFPNTIINWIFYGKWTKHQILATARGPFRVYRDDIDLGTFREMRFSGFGIIFARAADALIEGVFGQGPGHITIPRWETSYDEITRPPNADTGDPGGLLARGFNCPMSAWVAVRRNGHKPFSDDQHGVPGGTPWLEDCQLGTCPPKNVSTPRYWADHAQQNRQTNSVWWEQRYLRTFNPQLFTDPTQQAPPPDGYLQLSEEISLPYWDIYRWRKWGFIGALFDIDTLVMSDSSLRIQGEKSSYHPYVLGHDGRYENRHQFGMYDMLSVAWRPAQPLIWGHRMRNPTPLQMGSGGSDSSGDDGNAQADSGDGGLTGDTASSGGRPVNMAMAMVRVFNPTSWDLWTQNWRAQLTPVENLEPLRGLPESMPEDLARLNEFDSIIGAGELAPVIQFLQRLPQDPMLLEEVLNH